MTPVCMDVTALEFRDTSFDVIGENNTIRHLPPWDSWISRSLRMLRSGGTLVLLTTWKMGRTVLSDSAFTNYLRSLGMYALQIEQQSGRTCLYGRW